MAANANSKEAKSITYKPQESANSKGGFSCHLGYLSRKCHLCHGSCKGGTRPHRSEAQHIEADERTGGNVSPLKKEACYCGQRSKTREKLFCTSGGDAEETRCPCAIGNRCCTSLCKRFNCGNRPPGNNQSSCRCGANNKNGVEEVKSCTDTTGKRRTKCKCYKEMRPCTNKCGCYGCSNDYGRREASNVSSPQKRNIKCTSSPSSLKRKRTDKFLAENDFEIKQGSWTTEETCL